jgi:RNA polymerase sigma-70 factor (ECF subfamily)
MSAMRSSRPRLAYLESGDRGPSDEALASAGAAGDLRAIEELYRRYQRPVICYLQRLVRDNDLAVDLFMEAFFRAYANLGSFDPRRGFRPWLYRIATNVGLDWLRQRARALPPADAAAQEPSVFEAVAERELSRQVEEIVAVLPDEQRTAFILKHYQGLSYAEIAAVCGCPEGTVRSRMHYSVRVLRAKLRYLIEEGDSR